MCVRDDFCKRRMLLITKPFARGYPKESLSKPEEYPPFLVSDIISSENIIRMLITVILSWWALLEVGRWKRMIIWMMRPNLIWTYCLFLLPRLHSRFIFLKFMTPIRINLLIIIALIRWCTSAKWKCELLKVSVLSPTFRHACTYLWASTVIL